MSGPTERGADRGFPRMAAAGGAVAVAVVVGVVVAAVTEPPVPQPTTRSGSAPPVAQPTTPAESGPPVAQPTAPTGSASRVPAWSDEFDGPAGAPADPRNWTYETGGGGWGNEELQFYTDSTDNASLDGEGNLVITTRRIDPAVTELECWYGPCAFTSARLITERKQEFRYGRVEIRARLPEGAGVWPALWMLGTDIRDVGWPQSGEIDVMEFVGRAPDEIFGTIHGPGYSGGESFTGVHDLGAPVPGGWHVFTLEWSPDGIVWWVDGIAYHRASPADVAPDEWVFDQPFFLLTNVAVGGSFGGPVGDDVWFPQQMAVDYVRVYDADGTPG